MLEGLYYENAPNESLGGSFRVDKLEFFIPAEVTEDPEAEKEKLIAELKYTKGFLDSVKKKLSNKRFVENAPEQVIVVELKKETDALSKIETLKASLASL